MVLTCLFNLRKHFKDVKSLLQSFPYFSLHSFQPVLHDWCNKGSGMCYLVCGMVHIKEPLLLIGKSSLCGGSGMCYLVCGMVHIKEPLLLIGKSSLCGGSGFRFSLSEWSLTMSDAI